MRENGVCNERMRGQPLQADFAVALGDNPDDAELRFDLTHLDIKNFTGSNLSHDSLNDEAADAHVDYEAWVGKRLAMGIHSPNLYRKLNLDSWANSSIHARIVRHKGPRGNLPGLPQPEYWSVIVGSLNQQLGRSVSGYISQDQASSRNQARVGLRSCRKRLRTSY
jgi:hypothetical protein